jgi:ABC-type polysaccharide/polyol phosphate export permease
LDHLKELYASRELLSNLVMRDVKGKYRSTFFGQLWSLINPLATMLVYSFVFGVLFQRAQPNPGDPSGLNIYPLWLLCGLLPWLFANRVISGALSSITGSAGLIKKVYFPRVALPLAVTGSTAFTWLNEMGVLVVALLIFGGWHVLPWLPLVIVFMILLAAFSTGVGMALAILTVYFRDTQHFVAIILQMWMYLTPVVYPITLVQKAAAQHGAWLLSIYELNPMEHYVNCFRQLLYDQTWPDPVDTIWCVGCAVVFLALGWFVFQKFEKRLGVLL